MRHSFPHVSIHSLYFLSPVIIAPNSCHPYYWSSLLSSLSSPITGWPDPWQTLTCHTTAYLEPCQTQLSMLSRQGVLEMASFMTNAILKLLSTSSFMQFMTSKAYPILYFRLLIPYKSISSSFHACDGRICCTHSSVSGHHHPGHCQLIWCPAQLLVLLWGGAVGSRPILHQRQLLKLQLFCAKASSRPCILKSAPGCDQ